MKKVYSVEMRIYATAYIRAESAEAAMVAAKKLEGDALYLSTGPAGDIEISDNQYDDPDLPDVSLSPAMTIHSVEGEIDEA